MTIPGEIEAKSDTVIMHMSIATFFSAEILLSSETEQQQPDGRYNDGYKAILLCNSEEEVS